MKVLILMSFLGMLFGRNARAADVKVGDAGPLATALDETGTKVSLGDLYAKGKVLVYFYPKADTPGCTAQACSLRDSYEVLQRRGVTVIGVSTDSPADQKKFKEKYHLPFTLLADTEKKVTEAFGVSTTLGYASRQAFLIEEGKVTWLDRKASTKEQAKDVLAVLEKKTDTAKK